MVGRKHGVMCSCTLQDRSDSADAAAGDWSLWGSVTMAPVRQVWPEQSTSPSRSVSGTASASRARSAPSRWSAAASSPTAMTSSAPTAGERSEVAPVDTPPPPKPPD